MAMLALCALLTACGSEGLPPSGEPFCGESGAPSTLCRLPDGSPTDQSMPWFSRAVCSESPSWVTTWTEGPTGEVGPSGRDDVAGGAPATCSADGEPLCADGSAPRCEWWAVPDQDWQETCAELIRAAGLTEADCYVPLAPYPETTVDPARIYIEP